MTRALSCPKCRSHMTPYEHQGVLLDVCPKCHGLWCDTGELDKINKGPIDLVDMREIHPGPSPSQGAPCPRCGIRFREVFVRGGGSLRLDLCDRCDGIWLDAGELQRLERLRSKRLRHVAAQDARLLRQIKLAEREKERQMRSAARGGIEVESAHASDRGLVAFLLGIPVEEDNALARTPYAVYALVGGLLLIWLWQITRTSVETWHALAFVPDDVLAGHHLYTMMTACFIHGGWLHVLGNLYFLWMFGDNVEDRLGSVAFIAWYLLWGLCGAALTLATCHGEACASPHLGASGAIAGAMGAYLTLFPRSRIVKSIGGFFFWGVVIRLPAWAYLGFWILFQLGAGALELPAVGWWAHTGGFLAGAAVGLWYRRRTPED